MDAGLQSRVSSGPEFEKQLVEVQDFRKITNQFRGI